ncbi:unnamed protein product [Adineta steineri]|uniref:UNC93-like protein n=1 Tax=Adineta steineri TaxID=433720 RepID=A0A818SKA7_9BILA|nr:unnamed protein product [Adineta steineri]CAF1427430.1 unnamed protein product [Adineta steineri]CAF3673890.1 unnamed protein product [Adineta steineri]CAF3785629.1 unnamed protein product [Adineta steineri]
MSSDNEEKGGKSNKKGGGKKRNLSMICLAFLCIYTSFNAVNNLQSSINTDKNVGLYSLTILSAGSILSCFVFTIPLIYILGYKWTIVAGQIGILIYIAANMYPKAVLLYPVAAISGILRATMWTSQSAYITVLGADENGNDDSDVQVNKYFGIFYSIFQTAQIWGNLIVYVILRNVRKEAKSDFSQCGANFVPSTSETKNDESTISPVTTYILYSVFVGIILISIVFVIIFLDQKRKVKDDDSKGLIRQSIHYSLSTMKQFKKLDHLLLAPVVFWINSWEAFIFGIYTKSFITCTIGIQYIGLVMASYGLTACIVSITAGYAAKIKHSRPVCLLSAISSSIVILVVMLLWKPIPSQTYVLYILACIAGFSAAIAKPLVSALYSDIFVDTKEMAFSIFSMIQNLGYIVVYFYSSALIVRVSIILQIIYTGMAMICYIIIEIRQYRKSNDEDDDESQTKVLHHLAFDDHNEYFTVF